MTDEYGPLTARRQCGCSGRSVAFLHRHELVGDQAVRLAVHPAAVSASGASTRQNTFPDPSSNQYCL